MPAEITCDVCGKSAQMHKDINGLWHKPIDWQEETVPSDFDNVHIACPKCVEEQDAKKDNPPIKIWKYQDAPLKYKIQTKHRGQEDWLAVIPKEYERQDWVDSALEDGTLFGACNVQKEPLDNGDQLRIGIRMTTADILNFARSKVNYEK